MYFHEIFFQWEEISSFSTLYMYFEFFTSSSALTAFSASTSSNLSKRLSYKKAKEQRLYSFVECNESSGLEGNVKLLQTIVNDAELRGRPHVFRLLWSKIGPIWFSLVLFGYIWFQLVPFGPTWCNLIQFHPIRYTLMNVYSVSAIFVEIVQFHTMKFFGVLIHSEMVNLFFIM